MTILLTGASGFIGNHLFNFLKNQDYKIICLIRNNNSLLFDENIKLISEKNLFNLDQENSKIDIIIHLATHFTSNHSHFDIDGLIDANVKLGVKLLEVAKKHNAKFINTSSFAQSISKDKPYSQNLYALTKKTFQDILKYYCIEQKINAIDLELFDSYGPGDKRKKFYKLALNDLLKNDTFKMSGGEQEICLIHVRDIINAINICISMISKLNGYNPYTLLNNHDKYILKELAFKLKKICNSSSDIETGFYEYRNNEIFKLYSDYNLLPGWNSKISLLDGINELKNNIR